MLVELQSRSEHHMHCSNSKFRQSVSTQQDLWSTSLFIYFPLTFDKPTTQLKISLTPTDLLPKTNTNTIKPLHTTQMLHLNKREYKIVILFSFNF